MLTKKTTIRVSARLATSERATDLRGAQRHLLRRRVGGQIAPLMLVALLFICVIAIVTYNASRTTIAKMELVNAADAAAYSGGIQAAQSMNFMAYTNRAMVANTIAAGYIVAYISQLRYQSHLIQDVIAKPRRTFIQMLAIRADAIARQFGTLAEAATAQRTQQINDAFDQRQQYLDSQVNANTAQQKQQAAADRDDLLAGLARRQGQQPAPRDPQALANAEAAYQAALTNINSLYDSKIDALDYQNGETRARETEALERERQQELRRAEALIKLEYAKGRMSEADFNRLKGQAEANNRPPAAGSLSSKFARAGRAGGDIADGIFKAIGLATIPYIDSVNMAYAGIQVAEYGLMKSAIESTISDSAALYGQDISAEWVLDSKASLATFGWMLPVRPGLDGISATVHKKIGLRLRNLFKGYDGAAGSAGNGLLNLIFGQVFGVFDRHNLDGNKPGGFSLSPMQYFVTNSVTFQDAQYLFVDRSSRYTWQNVFGVPVGPIPSVNFNYRLDGLVYDMTPSSFSPFNMFAGSGFGSTALDLSGTSDFTVNYVKTQPPAGVSLEPPTPSQPISNAAGSVGALSQGQRDQEAERAEQARRNSQRSWVRGNATQTAALGSFQHRLGQALGAVGRKADSVKSYLSGSPAAGSDWVSKDELRMGMWIWDLKWKPGWFPLDFYKTLMATGYHLNKDYPNPEIDINRFAGGDASAKEFWPTYQGVPLYMALSELPWTDGQLNIQGGGDQRLIKVRVSRPLPKPLTLLTTLVPDQHDGDNQRPRMSAQAKAEVFYFRQPNDRQYTNLTASDQTGGHRSFQYFYDKAHVDNPAPTPTANFLLDTQVDPTDWFGQLKNWYGDKWANRMVKVNNIYLKGMKPSVGVSRELPNLMTPFWDARLAKY